MTAELPAQGGEHPFGEGVLLPGPETPHQGKGDDLGRHAGFDGLNDGPAAFTGIVDMAADVGEFVIFTEMPLQPIPAAMNG